MQSPAKVSRLIAGVGLGIGLFGAAALALAGAPAAKDVVATTGAGPAGQKAPGAVGVVAGQVPAQHEQALDAPIPPKAEADLYDAVDGWWEAGSGREWRSRADYGDEFGKLGVLHDGGAVQTKGHPFFEALGANGRACVTCHQPANGMTVSAAALQKQWEATGGKDPVFAAVDGANCPNLPQDQRASHSLLLDRGLFRVFLPWPPKAADGSSIKPEFSIEVVRDPTGCNTDAVYGLKSANPMVSVFRRPRVVANLKYVTNGGGLFNPKGIAMPMAVDPETGKRVSMNFMADAREPTLKAQAFDAILNHEQAKTPPSAEQLQRIVDFEMKVYSAQAADPHGGRFDDKDGPQSLGPDAMLRNRTGQLGDNLNSPVFGFFDAWKKPDGAKLDDKAAFRASVARGSDVFFVRPFWIRDTQFITTIGLGNPTKRTCATCHNAQMTGQDLVSGWVDLGTTNQPWANESPELPLFKITCNKDVTPHAFLGRVIYTQDPGRALISGRCIDVGSIVMQQFRGLAARAPYFSNGSAKSLRALVDFYDRRFNIRYSEQEKTDLVNFLSTL